MSPLGLVSLPLAAISSGTWTRAPVFLTTTRDIQRVIVDRVDRLTGKPFDLSRALEEDRNTPSRLSSQSARAQTNPRRDSEALRLAAMGPAQLHDDDETLRSRTEIEKLVHR